MPPKLTLVLRFLWYLFSRILIWAVAAALVVLSFFAAMDYMNVQILVKDGLQLRAKVIIQGDDPTALSKVFSRNFLEQDALLSSSVYRSYSIKNVDYSAKVDFQLIMPWQNAVELTVTEEQAHRRHAGGRRRKKQRAQRNDAAVAKRGVPRPAGPLRGQLAHRLHDAGGSAAQPHAVPHT